MAKAEKHTLKLEIEKPQYITVSDVTYAQVDSWFGHCRRDLKLDIIYPEAQDGRTYPCILWICGGAWLMMDKSAHNLYLSRLASGGFVVASVEYRTSAGGYLTCMAALDHDPALDVGEYLEESSEVQAACPWYPPTDLSAFPCESAEQCASSAESLLLGFNSKRNREKAYNCSPVSKVTKDAPPFLIIHGNCDRTVPYVQSKTLYNLLEAQGCDVTLLTLDGADHADLQFFQDETWNWIIDFFNRKLK